ncbi:HAD-IA family hydrolase [Vibrio rarus]|uniref:HAD-IA family hydrolase n=1 Tax=Vibrio rarus TaxID=413403 RepID=UPI0021C2A296|nr:HAD-IA family hydrolase [Vibrio rarus]
MRFYRSLNPIQAMTFDLDDTLYDNHPVIRRLERDLRVWLNQRFPLLQKYTESDWHAWKRQALQHNELCRHDVTLARETQLAFAFDEIGLAKPSQAEAVKLTMHQVAILRNRVEIPEATFNTLDKLVRRLPLLAITNGNVDLQRIGLQDYFIDTLKAGPNGAAKPHPDMFAQATSILDVPASSILHVGDHLYSDVLGAKNAGLQAAWLNNSALGIESFSQGKILPDVEFTAIEQLLYFV